MRLWLLLSAICALAFPVSAQTLPALYDVVNVDSNDTLNIREEPSTDASIWSELAFNARDIEVVEISQDGRWGLINAGETTGWVSMRYLAPVPAPEWFTPEARLTCVGTEPFWSFSINSPNPAQATFSAMAEDITRSFSVDWHSGQVARPFIAIGLGGTRSDQPGAFFAVIRHEACHVGMSDQNFGLDIDLFFHGEEGASGYEGCCSVRP